VIGVNFGPGVRGVRVFWTFLAGLEGGEFCVLTQGLAAEPCRRSAWAQAGRRPGLDDAIGFATDGGLVAPGFGGKTV
jgi:hypothetical protein